MLSSLVSVCVVACVFVLSLVIVGVVGVVVGWFGGECCTVLLSLVSVAVESCIGWCCVSFVECVVSQLSASGMSRRFLAPRSD